MMFISVSGSLIKLLPKALSSLLCDDDREEGSGLVVRSVGWRDGGVVQCLGGAVYWIPYTGDRIGI